MKCLAHSIFSELEDKILQDSYYPRNPIETLKTRLTATWLLQTTNPELQTKAKAFLAKTSTFKEKDLARLQKLALQTKCWDELQICSSYANTQGTFLEYKLAYTTLNGQKKTVHRHARYEMSEDHCYFVSQTPPLIRIAGDPILQRPGVLFPVDPALEQEQELITQVKHAKSILIQTSGAGIAANQCAMIKNPYCLIIAGVFYEIPEHVKGVKRRYPGTTFPQARIMLNPVITDSSKEYQHFNHACLSVPCANRCAILSPLKMSVRYQDPLDNMALVEAEYTGINAVVLWHELHHILYGKTYMDITFESLAIDDLLQFQTMITDEIKRRHQEGYFYVPELSVPPFYFSVRINEKNIPKLDPAQLAAVLPDMSEDTLCGLLKQAGGKFKQR